MKLRYKLRTLLILLAILPPLLWIGWTKYAAWKAEQERLEALRIVAQQQEYEAFATGVLSSPQPPAGVRPANSP